MSKEQDIFYDLAMMYHKDGDDDIALEFALKGANNGDHRLYTFVARTYGQKVRHSNSHAVEQMYSRKEFDWYNMAFEYDGDQEAVYKIAQYYYIGKYPAYKDIEKAFEILTDRISIEKVKEFNQDEDYCIDIDMFKVYKEMNNQIDALILKLEKSGIKD